MTAPTKSLEAYARLLIQERDAAERKAKQAQECLEEVQRKLALIKLQTQCDTPLSDLYGG